MATSSKTRYVVSPDVFTSADRSKTFDFFTNEKCKPVGAAKNPTATDMDLYWKNYDADYPYVIERHPSKIVAIILSAVLPFFTLALLGISDYFAWIAPIVAFGILFASLLFTRRYRYPNHQFPVWGYLPSTVGLLVLLIIFYFKPDLVCSSFGLLGQDAVNLGANEAYRVIWAFKVTSIGIAVVACVLNIVFCDRLASGFFAAVGSAVGIALFALIFRFALTEDTIAKGIAESTFYLNLFLGIVALILQAGASVGLGFLARGVYR